MSEDMHECEICGHNGTDVERQDNPYRSGYFCKDIKACFEKFCKQRVAPEKQHG